MSDKLQEIKDMVFHLDGDFTAQAFGYDLNGQEILEFFKWLIERVEQSDNENERLREALNYYAYEQDYADGDIAKEALSKHS